MTEPWLTGLMPVIARINVVLPAPFGPSNPVTPAPKEQLSSDSATFAPNHTETLVISTVGSSTNAGSGIMAGGWAATGGGNTVTVRPSGNATAA